MCRHLVWTCLGLIICGASAAVPAAAHSWYPDECCSGEDCMPVDDIDRDAAGDYVVRAGRHVVRVPRAFPVRPSPDGRPHVCFREEHYIRINLPRCLFLPAES